MMNSTKSIITEVVGQKSIVSNYAFLLFRTFILTAISFASTVFVYRILSVENVGFATIYVAVLNTINGLFLVWPVTGLLQYGREEYDRTRRLERTFGSTLSLMAILFVIGTTVCVLLRKPLMGYIGLPTKWLWLLIFNVLFIMFNKILIQVFYITGSISVLSILDLIEPLLMLLFVVYIWMTAGSIPVTTYLLVSACFSAVTFFFYVFFSRQYIFPFGWSFPEAKRILRFSAFLYGAAIFSFIYDQFDYLIINHYRPTEQLAYYSLAYRIYTFITMLPMLSINLIYPVMISYRNLGRKDIFEKYSSRTVTQMLFFWTIGCIAFLWVSPFLIPLLFGEVYRYSIPSFSLFCMAAIFQFTIACNSPIITSHERIDWSMKVNLIGTIVIGIGNLLLIPSMGILGAALAALISYAFNSLAYSYLTARLMKGRYKGYEIIMALFCFPMVIVTIVSLPFIIRILTFGLELAVMFSWSYRYGVFNTADLFFLEHIALPRPVRKMIYTVFTWLEPRSGILKNIEL
jgi:O-antigen/teichoic acid export membrane protein